MKLGTIIREQTLSRDDDGMRWPKKEWGYAIDVDCNGYHISAPDCNRFEAMKGALEAVRWAMEMPAWERKDRFNESNQVEM